MENFESIGEVVNKLIERLQAEMMHPSSNVILYSRDAANAGTLVPSNSQRRKATRNAGYGQ